MGHFSWLAPYPPFALHERHPPILCTTLWPEGEGVQFALPVPESTRPCSSNPQQAGSWFVTCLLSITV